MSVSAIGCIGKLPFDPKEMRNQRKIKRSGQAKRSELLSAGPMIDRG